MDTINIAVTGDVDAGKSTLIARYLCDTAPLYRKAAERLRAECDAFGGSFELAYLLDSFEEERRDNFTLDTTQVVAQERGRRLLFIDVPGHLELLRNMLCGASCADAAVLVIDVRKALEPQTRRHAQILKFLAVSQVIVCVNKMDSAGFSEEAFVSACRDVRGMLKEAGLAAREIVPVSAREGDNILVRSRRLAWYRGPVFAGALRRLASAVPPRDFRFCVQDTYARGGKDVSAGLILSGRVAVGNDVTVFPSGGRARVLSVVSLGSQRSAAVPAAVGVVISLPARRGSFICSGRPPLCGTRIRCRLFAVKTLRAGSRMRLRCLTQDTQAVIREIHEVHDACSVSEDEGGLIRENRVAFVDLESETPLVFETGNGAGSLGRFVLYDGGDICAAGIFCRGERE